MNETTQQRLRLYLIRHGEVEEAASGKLLGRTDAALSTRGLEQAQQLAELLSTAQLSTVYCSDLRRAKTTAEIIAKERNLKVRESRDWREIDMGAWEGLTMASLQDSAPELVAQLFTDPVSFEYPNGESFAAFAARVRRALDEMLANWERGQVALVTHGGVCRVIVSTVLEIPARNWLRVAQDYGCLNVIDWFDHNPIMRLLNQS